MGTVIGMIDAFDKIQAGDIQPSLVAGGIKVALITRTVGGLIVAMIFKYSTTTVMLLRLSIVTSMEEASTLLDILVKYNQKH